MRSGWFLHQLRRFVRHRRFAVFRKSLCCWNLQNPVQFLSPRMTFLNELPSKPGPIFVSGGEGKESFHGSVSGSEGKGSWQDLVSGSEIKQSLHGSAAAMVAEALCLMARRPAGPQYTSRGQGQTRYTSSGQEQIIVGGKYISSQTVLSIKLDGRCRSERRHAAAHLVEHSLLDRYPLEPKKSGRCL